MYKFQASFLRFKILNVIFAYICKHSPLKLVCEQEWVVGYNESHYGPDS